MGDRKDRIGHVSTASWYWVWTIVGMIAYELAMLAWGNRGGALSHVIWWANDVDTGLYSWRWALVSGPLAGFCAWLIPHFSFGWGNGLHLLVFMLVSTAIHGLLVVFLGQ